MSQPKLIIFNGPLGIGKSTLAKRYGDDHPLTLVMDMDDLRAMLSGWRANKEESAQLSREMAYAAAKISFRKGNDVVIPQMIFKPGFRKEFLQLAKAGGAKYYEVLLFVERKEAIKRFIERGKNTGNPTGFRVGGLIDQGGREELLGQMYDDMIKNITNNVIKVTPIIGDIETTYQEIARHLNS